MQKLQKKRLQLCMASPNTYETKKHFDELRFLVYEPSH